MTSKELNSKEDANSSVLIHDDSPIKVLLVEDNPADARLIQVMLAESSNSQFILQQAGRLQAGLEYLSKTSIDVVLLDLSLPDSQGLEGILRVQANSPDVPIVVLTGFDDQRMGLEAVRMGAQDYLIKGNINSQVLFRVLRYAMERHRMLLALDHSRKKQLEIKDQFLSHISQELRTPLTAIYQFMTILLDGLAGELNSEQREYLEISLKNLNQLGTMIGDLLDATRADTGKLTVEPQRLSPGSVISESMRTLEKTAADKNINLSTNVAADLPHIYADPDRVRQILINLIDNGIKFTPENGRVSVHAEASSEDSDFIQVSVVDTGCGISNEALDLVFERLYQEASATETSRRGLGLGLYICKELVSRQGGKIWVESKVGKGSTFCFTLPRFSLEQLLLPVIKKSNGARNSIALFSVEIFLADTLTPVGISERTLTEISHILERCVRPDDLLLPRMGYIGEHGVWFLVVNAERKGAEVVMERVREQLQLSRTLKREGLTASISLEIVDVPAVDGDRPLEQIVKEIAERIEELIGRQIRKRREVQWGERKSS